jgi:hypothetical protein
LTNEEEQKFQAFRPLNTNLSKIGDFFMLLRTFPRSYCPYLLETYLFMSLHHSTVLSAVYERWTEWVLPLFNKGVYFCFAFTFLALNLLVVRFFFVAQWKVKEAEMDANLITAAEKRFQAILMSTVAQIHYYKFTQKGAVLFLLSHHPSSVFPFLFISGYEECLATFIFLF